MKKGGGRGKRVVVESIPFGGDTDAGQLTLGVEESKAQAPIPKKLDNFKLSPEGASIKDICIFNEHCKKK